MLRLPDEIRVDGDAIVDRDTMRTIRAMAYRHSNTREQYEDAVQTAMLHHLKRRGAPQYVPGVEVWTTLCDMSRRESTSRGCTGPIMSRRNRQRLEEQGIIETTEESIELLDKRVHIAALLNHLDHEEKQVVALRFAGPGMSPNMIASTLGVKRSAIVKILTKAMTKMREAAKAARMVDAMAA